MYLRVSIECVVQFVDEVCRNNFIIAEEKNWKIWRDQTIWYSYPRRELFYTGDDRFSDTVCSGVCQTSRN